MGLQRTVAGKYAGQLFEPMIDVAFEQPFLGLITLPSAVTH